MDEQKNQQDPDQIDDHFYLPDLCKAQPLFVLVLVAVLLVLVQSVLHSSVFNFDWDYFSELSFYALWNVLLCSAGLCNAREQIQRLPITSGALVAYGLVLIISFFLSIAGQSLLASGYHGAMTIVFDPAKTASHLVVVSVMGGIALRYMYLQQKLQIQEQARLHAQIQALQSRIRPHFLFNSMNIVASLIGSDPKRAERVIEDMAELFRASLRAGDNLVTLKEELDLCRQYTDIEQLRLGDRLAVNWDLDEAALVHRLPSLTLQPLVENAVYHGIQPRAEGGVVDVSAKLQDDKILIIVSNPLPSESEQKINDRSHGNQIAVANTRARLKGHFGEDAELKTIFSGNRFSAEISYSVKK